MWTPGLARIRIAVWSLAIAAAFGACNLHNEGVDAPRGALSYPQALALSRESHLTDAGVDAGEGQDFLYIANTNYDLRYNGGSVQSFSLRALERKLVANNCRELDPAVMADAATSVADNTLYANRRDAGLSDGGVPSPGLGGMDGSISVASNWTAEIPSPRGVLCDGRDDRGDGRLLDDGTAPDCCWGTYSELAEGVEEDRLLKAHVSIDSYASGVAVSPDNQRLYVPVESFSRLLYFDLTDGVPDCGTTERCRRGPGLKSRDEVPSENFPGQIANLVVGKLSELGVVKAPSEDPTFIATTHELGGIGLFVESNGAPVLEDALSGNGKAPRPTSLTFDSNQELLYVTSSNQSYFRRLGVRVTSEMSEDEPGPRELLFETSPVVVTGVSQANDLRDIVIDPFNPERIWALIRGSQEAIAIIELDPSLNANARLVDEIKIGDGPSKLRGIEQDGRFFVLVSAYDEKKIFVIDALSRSLVAVVRNLSGPFQMVHDPARRLVYVTDFRVSVVRVIDVAGLTQRDKPPPRIVATLGDPEFEGNLN
jgi:DNA-binding beta-propeller fold protein YncE